MRFPESLCRKQLEALHQAAIPAELRFFREQAKKMLAPILGALHQETNERFELRDFDGKAARQRAANKTKYEDRIHPENFLKNSVYFSVERVAMRPRFLFWGKPVETRKTVAHVNVRIADHSWEAALFDRKMNAMTTARGAACKFLNTPNLSAIDKALPPRLLLNIVAGSQKRHEGNRASGSILSGRAAHNALMFSSDEIMPRRLQSAISFMKEMGLLKTFAR